MKTTIIKVSVKIEGYLSCTFTRVLILCTVRIGFEETAYTVNEEVDFQKVCVRVFEPDQVVSLGTEISAVIATRVGTAGKHTVCLIPKSCYRIIIIVTCARAWQLLMTTCTGMASSYHYSLIT